ncbi:MAG: SdrD B-like domain-containing protein [Clostridium sp.]
MSNITITSDTNYNGESKVLLEIVSKGPNTTERSCHRINTCELLSKGVEVKLGFRGEDRIAVDGGDQSIINTETFPTEGGREVILRIGRKKVSSVRVVVEYNNNMPLDILHMISQDSDYICERKCALIEGSCNLPTTTIDSSLSDEYFEFDDDNTCDIEDYVIEGTVISTEYNIQRQDDFEDEKRTVDGTLHYVMPAGQRQPRNICLNGIRVKLYNEENKLISTRITRRIGKKNGYFKFTGLDSGAYSMKVLLPSNLEFIHGRDITIGGEDISLDLIDENIHDMSIGVIKKL